MRERSAYAVAIVALSSFLAAPQLLLAEDQPPATAEYTGKAPKLCLACHKDEHIALVVETPHGDASNPRSPFSENNHACESCHGPGSRHVGRVPRGGSRSLMIRFGPDSELSTGDQNDVCIGCHRRTVRDFPTSLHSSQRCSGCHESHAAEDPMRVKAEQENTCFRCHKDAIEVHPRFEKYGIQFDALQCGSCHDIHQLEKSAGDQAEEVEEGTS